MKKTGERKGEAEGGMRMSRRRRGIDGREKEKTMNEGRGG